MGAAVIRRRCSPSSPASLVTPSGPVPGRPNHHDGALSWSASCRPLMPANRLLPGPGVEDLAMVDGGLFVSPGAVEGCCPPGCQCYQRAIPGGRPLLEPAHQGPADAAAAMLAAEKDF